MTAMTVVTDPRSVAETVTSPSGSLVPSFQPTVWLIMMVCAHQLARSSGPSTVSLKSFWALIWLSQSIGGVSSE